MELPADATLLSQVELLATQAGAAILNVYHQSRPIAVSAKQDDSPLTEADMASHKLLIEGLPRLMAIPVVSEEGSLPPYQTRKSWEAYWMIDPLDGTKEFLQHNGEFTVNIALIHQHRPILGVVHAPALDVTYAGIVNLGAHKQTSHANHAIRTRSLNEIAPGDHFAVVASRRHGAEAVDQLLERLQQRFGELHLTSMGSSLKLCLVAEGAADLYPRLAPTCEWDTAAAQAVVEAAGGQVLTNENLVLQYSKEDILNPHFFVVGDKTYSWSETLRSS